MARTTVKDKRELARTVSLILNPAVMIALQMMIIIRAFAVTPEQLFKVSLPFLLPVSCYIIIMVFVLKKVDYDFTSRMSRWPVLILAIGGLLISVPASLQMAPELTGFLMRMLVLFVLIATVTFLLEGQSAYGVFFHDSYDARGLHPAVTYCDVCVPSASVLGADIPAQAYSKPALAWNDSAGTGNYLMLY